MFLINLLLALLWVAVSGRATLPDFVVGFLLGAAVLRLLPTGEGQRYVRRLGRIARAAGVFLWEIVLANLRVTYHVFAPLQRMRPGIVAVPLRVKSDAAITMLANIITLTPGTLSLDVSDDRSVLYVHGMNVSPDPQAFRAEIANTLEQEVQEVMES